MREIKFRAWAPEDRCIYDWEYMNHMSVKDISTDTAWKYMQYTGLKDKNGKEIYEGDVVQRYTKSRELKIETITYSYHRAGFSMFSKGKRGDFVRKHSNGSFVCPFIEIIGNIYEHPHLLK